MEKKGTGKIVVIIILLIIVLGLGGYLGYHILVEDKENTNEIKKLKEEIKDLKSKEEAKKENYTYKDVAGLYKFTGTKDEAGEDTFRLQLDENGLFVYDKEKMASAGYIGNYVIKNDEIHLNAVFYHRSDALLEVRQEQTVLKIDSKGNIIDKNLDKFDTGQTKKYDEVVLQKDSKTEITSISKIYNFKDYAVYNPEVPLP